MTSPQRVVVDVSIAQAAGGLGALASESRTCTSILEALRDHGCFVVTCDEWLTEWHRHRSRYSYQWLSSMFARRKVRKVSLSAAQALHNCVVGKTSPTSRATVMKDIYLICASFAADRRILSLDEEVRNLLKGVGSACPRLCDILWANPMNDAESVLGWIAAGLPFEADRSLCV